MNKNKKTGFSDEQHRYVEEKIIRAREDMSEVWDLTIKHYSTSLKASKVIERAYLNIIYYESELNSELKYISNEAKNE